MRFLGFREAGKNKCFFFHTHFTERINYELNDELKGLHKKLLAPERLSCKDLNNQIS